MRELLKKLSSVLPVENTYLVGGFVRDHLLGREPEDIDLVVERGDIGELAQRVAKELGGHLFGFKKENIDHRGEVYTVLIPYRGGEVRVDLSSCTDIEQDLLTRDFTINAIAQSLKDFLAGKGKYIDPTGGLDDLGRKRVRAVSPGVLESDPLRMLRAYRIARQLGFTLDPATREFISQRGELIKNVAPERVINELLKLFSLRGTFESLKLLKEDGFDLPLLGFPIGEKALKGVERFEELQKGDFLKNLKGQTDFKEKTFLGTFDTDTLVKLALFLFPHGGWENFLERYPLGEGGKKFISYSLRGFKELLEKYPKSVKEKHLYLKRYSPYLYPIGVLAKVYGPFEVFRELLDFYRRWKESNKPLIGGREVMELLGLSRGSPLVGEVLEKLVLAQLEGKVKDRQGAIDFVKTLKGEPL